MTEPEISPAAPADEPLGDLGDQAQRLQMVEEQEAIKAALAGRPHGDDTVDRAARIENLEGADPMTSPLERDSSDDPVHGGEDVTGDEIPDEEDVIAEQLDGDPTSVPEEG